LAAGAVEAAKAELPIIAVATASELASAMVFTSFIESLLVIGVASPLGDILERCPIRAACREINCS
jgi:hypothetical protein